MSKADEMFEKTGNELCYEGKRVENKDSLLLRYENVFENSRIDFWNDKTICKGNKGFEVGYFTMQELQAINEKCKELGWI